MSLASAAKIHGLTLAILVAVSAIPLHAQLNTQPAQASDYPLDQWARAGDYAQVRWDLHLPNAVLSAHQRLVQTIQVVLPGKEVEKRRGDGELVLLARIEDSQGRRWSTGSRMSLTHVEAGLRGQDLSFSFLAFIRPGTYKVTVALCDTASDEHNFARRVLHVAALRDDPLPGAWSDLPAVEFLTSRDAPDAWAQPEVTDFLNLPAASGLPARVDILVNATPSERGGASSLTSSPVTALRRNMAAVIPSLKALAALNLKSKPPSAVLLDTARHTVNFEAVNAASLDWSMFGKVVMADNPGVIDVKALALQRSMRSWLADQIGKRACGSDVPHWLVILSGTLMLSQQDEGELPALPPDPSRHIVYFRFLPGAAPGLASGMRLGVPERIHGPLPGRGTVLPIPPGRGGPSPEQFPDDIERIVKSMGGRVVLVSSPDQFRRALASLVAEIRQAS